MFECDFFFFLLLLSSILLLGFLVILGVIIGFKVGETGVMFGI
jgi:hypothetical protein